MSGLRYAAARYRDRAKLYERSVIEKCSCGRLPVFAADYTAQGPRGDLRYNSTGNGSELGTRKTTLPTAAAYKKNEDASREKEHRKKTETENNENAKTEKKKRGKKNIRKTQRQQKILRKKLESEKGR